MTIPVFYTPEQSASGNRSYSPSAQKPTLVVEAWQQSGIPIRIIRPEPAAVTDLCRAHDPAYVRGVLAGRVKNGFGNTLPEIAATLPWTCGSLLSAAEHAVASGESAFSPTAGFHHAGWDAGHAFCTFNGLLVAALALHARGQVQRVAILDCDQHFGDGTRDGIRRLGLDWIGHYTYGADPPTREIAEDWLAALPGIAATTAAGADLVFFQAGADPHEDDPWGGCLSSEQLARRDRIVFETCRELGVPVVINLAGGYQKPVEKVIDLHVQTLWAFTDRPSAVRCGPVPCPPRTGARA